MDHDNQKPYWAWAHIPLAHDHSSLAENATYCQCSSCSVLGRSGVSKLKDRIFFLKYMELSDEFKKILENETGDDDKSSENISDSFICCICLELLYKPIVLACGHISCFWCVYRSMNILRESNCPICRHPYNNFPAICKMLHLLLFKIYPVAYKRRDIQILEYEKGKGTFSPEIDDTASIPETRKGLHHVGSSEYDLLSHPSTSKKYEILHNVELSRSFVEDSARSNLQVAAEDVEPNAVFVDQEEKCQQKISSGTCHQISRHDVLCTMCKEILFRPVILNCGHAYCESCIVLPTNKTLRCQECQIKHPGEAPKVCMQMNTFLEELFPAEYTQRRTRVQLKLDHLQQESSSTCSSEDAAKSLHLSAPSPENLLSWWGDHKIHVGAGCDCCGMYPIIGDRYRCKDCAERMGYDLCGECYATGSKLPGRFNQQHTTEHTFEITRPNSICNVVSRLLRGQLGDATNAPNPSPDTTENVHPSLSSDVPEAAGSDFSANDSENHGDQQ